MKRTIELQHRDFIFIADTLLVHANNMRMAIASVQELSGNPLKVPAIKNLEDERVKATNLASLILSKIS